MSRQRAEPVRIPRRAFVLVVVLVLAIAAVGLVIGLGALARAGEPATVATAAEMKIQQAAAERDVERAYEQATGQVVKVRKLNLAITAAQADQIANKALSDLKALRHSAFVSLGQVQSMSGNDAETYATVVEQRFDKTPVASASPSPSPVLLAPRFYTIVSRMSDLATQIADNATTELTASPSASPTGVPRPTPSPSPSR